MHAECGSFATAVHVIIKSTNPQVKKEIMPDIRSCRRRNGRIADDLMAYEPNEQAAAECRSITTRHDIAKCCADCH
jgi:hypothetical protein